MKRLAVILAMFGGAAQADSTSLALQLPTPSMSYQSDSFRAGELDCSMAIGGSLNLELGVLGGLTIWAETTSPHRRRTLGYLRGSSYP